MTPKEKADDLALKMRDRLKDVQIKLNSYDEWDVAKACALVAVDEIITCYNWPFNELKYYMQVKKEIIDS